MQVTLYGLQVTVLGMLVVFAGLIILVVAIGLLRRLTGGKKQAVVSPAQDAAPVPTLAPVEYAQASEPEAGGALIAVITAAVAAAMAAQGGTAEQSNGFVVRAIRRVQGAPAWNRAGREEQVYGRF